MTVLSAQTIRSLCLGSTPLIDPFVEAGQIRGRSYGLSACTYDCRAAEAVLIPVGQSRLAYTLEYFRLPSHICASVVDKSTWARAFMTAFNTHLDPGWEGHLTVELSNLGDAAIDIQPGDPIIQVKFELLDRPTELPYRGKYQCQESKPVGPRYYPSDGRRD